MRTSAPLAAVFALASAIAAAGERAALPALERVYVNPAPAPVADFTLTDQAGKPRRFSGLKGEPVLVFFGFTHCPSVCPTALGRLKLLHESQDGALKQARIVLISVDGERDTPARLGSFLAPLSSDFIGLTGDPKVTAAIAAQFAAVFFKEPAGKDGRYNVMHSTQVFAVDKEGRLRASFADASIEDMATITALLLAEPG
ncbi:MAG TPA: SCO family protein [Steroidobacteraceae bacterium]|nr:SCO family protein [Steroidobacteraceae bacterium]